MNKMSKLYKDEIDNALPNGLSDKLLCTQGIWNKKKSVFTVSFINIKYLPKEVLQNGGCTHTDLLKI